VEGLVFRLFVSSTFADFKTEREILQRYVFPRLRRQAMAGGARFVPIDLRWGVSSEARHQQETMEICLREVDRCYEEGQPPQLLALLGHRRGWQPLPASIPVEVWKRGAPDLHPEDLTRLKGAYRRDDNSNSWMLQPKPDKEREADERLLRPSVETLAQSGAPADQARRLLAAATEQELLQAFDDRRKAGTDALILIRTLDHLPELISKAQEPSAKDFFDLRTTNGGWTPVEGSHAALTELAEKLVGNKGSARARLHTYRASWDDAGATIELSKWQRQAFAHRALTELSEMMAVTLGLEAESPRGPSSREGRSHGAVRRQLVASFVGREDELDRLRALLPSTVPNEAGPPRPVVIVSGPPGSGKTALMAKAAEQAEKDATVVIARFAGVTPASASAFGLCRSINLELAQYLGPAATTAAPARRGDLFAVADLLDLPTEEERRFSRRRRLAVFIDGVDLIASPRLGGRAAGEFRWLPPTMPPQVTLVLSADEDTTPVLADWFLAHELIKLGPMSSADASAALEMIFHQAERSPRPRQSKALLERKPDGWLPLPLRVAAQDATRWPSWAAGKDLSAATTFSEVLERRLSDPRRHGKVLVASALGYLLAARDGLSEAELRQLLAHDERVISDLAARFPYDPLPMAKGKERAVPDAVLSRLLLDLSPYLDEYPVEDQSLLRLGHGEFRRAALRYVADEDGRPAADWHRRVARYFRDQWQLPAALNPRAVAELPYQLARTGQWGKLTAIVTDLGYLEALVTGAAPVGLGRDEGPAEAVWYAGPALAELLAVAREAAARKPAARHAAQALQAVLDAVVRERRSLSRWPRYSRQQLANRLLADPVPPAGLAEALRRQSTRSPRAWLEITSAHASPALIADGLDLPGAISNMISADRLGALTVLDSAGTLASWDPAGYDLAKVFRRPAGPALAALAPLGDGRVLTCDRTGILELWDVPRYRKQPGPVGSLVAGITAMAYLPGDHLLIAATEHEMHWWDFDGSAAECRLAGQQRWLTRPGARWLWNLPGGRLLAVGPGQWQDDADQTWEAACLRTANRADIWRAALPAEPWAAAVDEARGLLALGDSAHRLTLRRLESGAVHGSDLDVGDVPMSLAFTPPGPDDPHGPDVPSGPEDKVTLLVGRADGWLARHAVPGGQVGLLPAHDGPVRSVALHPESARAVTGGNDGRVKSWDLRAGEWREFTAVRQVSAAAFDATSRWALVCCGETGTYRVSATDGEWTALAGLAVPLNPAMAALPGGQGVVVTLEDDLLGWLLPGGAPPRTIPLPLGVETVTALAGTGNATGVFAADSGGGLSLLPLDGRATAEPARAAGRVRVPGGAAVTVLAPAPDGQGVLAGDERGRLTTWTADGLGGLTSGPRTRTDLAGITALAVAPGRGTVAAGSRLGTVVLMNDDHKVPLGHHGAPVTSIAVGLGGRVAVTAAGGEDPALCVWDLAGSAPERLLTRLPLPYEPVALSFLPDQPDLAVLGRYGRLRNLRLHLPDAQAATSTGTE
jgi:AAA ATPase domain/Domain of unknown function (DUF4062)/WD domain, G-beta repeat